MIVSLLTLDRVVGALKIRGCGTMLDLRADLGATRHQTDRVVKQARAQGLVRRLIIGTRESRAIVYECVPLAPNGLAA